MVTMLLRFIMLLALTTSLFVSACDVEAPRDRAPVAATSSSLAKELIGALKTFKSLEMKEIEGSYFYDILLTKAY